MGGIDGGVMVLMGRWGWWYCGVDMGGVASGVMVLIWVVLLVVLWC